MSSKAASTAGVPNMPMHVTSNPSVPAARLRLGRLPPNCRRSTANSTEQLLPPCSTRYCPNAAIVSKYVAGVSAVAVRHTGRAIVSTKPSNPTVMRLPCTRLSASCSALIIAQPPLGLQRHNSLDGFAARLPELRWSPARAPLFAKSRLCVRRWQSTPRSLPP